MNSGRPSKRLHAEQIERLKWFMRGKRYSLAQLRLAMDAPFTWQTVQRAISGKPVWELNHAFIVDWLDRYVPVKPGPRTVDYKSAAAHDDSAENDDPPVPGRLRSEGADE